MIESLTIGIAGIVIMLLTWVLIQSMWRKTFSDHINDDDVLAGRIKCSNCGCTTICKQDVRELKTN